MTDRLAPGWHVDPEDATQLRYWDGTGWTSHVSALPAPPEESSSDAAQPDPTPNPVRKSGVGCFGAFVIGLMIVFVGVVIVIIGYSASSTQGQARTNSSSGGTTRSVTPPAPPAEDPLDASMKAQGYQVVASGDIYVKAADPSEFTCGHYKCLYYSLITSKGCARGVYMQASVETSDGVSIGMTNSITAGLQPGQSASVLLEDYTGSGDRFRLTDVHCMG